MTNDERGGTALKPLNIRCTSAQCESGLHCFMPKRKASSESASGKCRYCGANLIEWPRVHRKDPAEVTYVFSALKFECFRHFMWHVGIDQRALNYARRKGRIRLRAAAERRIRKHLGAANPPFDGRQTPREGSGNPVCYAQHATAVCCRKCVEYWHGIPRGRDLSESEIEYLTQLVMMYLLERIPNLTETGEKVPPIRRAAGS